MLTGKYISLEAIIERTLRDTGLVLDMSWVDAAEWAGNALDLIKAPMTYTNRVTDGVNAPYITIENGRGELPCDLVNIIQTRHCNGSPMRYSSDSFHLSKHVRSSEDLHCVSDITYTLNDNYIFPNFESGEIEMSYEAFPTDERGFPMLPDNEVFQQAIVAYIGERMGYKLFLRDKLARDKYHLLKQEREWYIGKAQTSALIPNRDKIESMVNQFRRIVTFGKDHYDGYRTSTALQSVRNHTPHSRRFRH